MEKTETKEKHNKIFLGYQQHQVVEWRKNQHFEDHLCPRPQGTEKTISRTISVLVLRVPKSLQYPEDKDTDGP
jgi:hypothetical protein